MGSIAVGERNKMLDALVGRGAYNANAAFFAKECRQGIDLLDKLNAELTQMQTQVTREQTAQRTAQAVSSSALPTKTQALNPVTCGDP